MAISDDPLLRRCPTRRPATRRRRQQRSTHGDRLRVGVPRSRDAGRSSILAIMVEVSATPCDYLYELFNQQGTVDGLHRAGYDLVIVGGSTTASYRSENNAGVLADAIRQLAGTPGSRWSWRVSMGGLSAASRAGADGAVAGEPHGARVYLSIDAPHGGTYTSPACSGSSSRCGRSRRVSTASPGCSTRRPTQQLMIEWFRRGPAWSSSLRDRFVDELEQLGYPGAGCASWPSRAGVATASSKGTPALPDAGLGGRAVPRGEAQRAARREWTVAAGSCCP